MVFSLHATVTCSTLRYALVCQYSANAITPGISPAIVDPLLAGFAAFCSIKAAGRLLSDDKKRDRGGVWLREVLDKTR